MENEKQSRRHFFKQAALGASVLPFSGSVLDLSRYGEEPGEPGLQSSRTRLSPAGKKGAVVKPDQGIPELFVDGEKTSRMWGRLALPSDYAPEKMDQYLEAGIKVYFTALDTAISLCWDGEDGYYFEKYEAHVKRLAEKLPDVRLILYTGGTGGAPYKWCRDHEEELTLFDSGKRIETASIASETWKRDSSKAFAHFVEYFENSKYADNVIGYNPVYNSNEWFSHHRAASGELGWPDFSKPMLLKFRSWLKEKYKGDEHALRESWKDPDVTFDTANIPTVRERLYQESPYFFSTCTPVGNKVADYYNCYDETLADLGIAWCKTIKEAGSKPILAGMMYGYSYCGKHDSRTYPQHFGHGAVMKVLQSEWVDFLHSPYDYFNRSIGGTHFSQHAADSVFNHNKLMVDQIDTKTFLRHGPNTNAETPRETREILKRDISYSLTKNFYCYWLEGGPGSMFPIVSFSPGRFGRLWYDHPEIKQTIAQLKKLHDENQRLKPHNVTEVAILTSNTGGFYRKFERVHGTLFTEIFRQWILPKIGLPFDDYLLEDLPGIRKQYKAYIFLDPVYVPSRLRDQIIRKLDDDRATAVWFYGPGYLDERGCSLSNTEELTGIKIAEHKTTSHLHIDLVNKEHELLRDVCENNFGSDTDPQKYKKDIRWLSWPYRNADWKMNPLFWCNDPGAEILGYLRNIDKPGMAVKELNNRRSVYFGAPLPPAVLIRNILEDAGVHVYNKAEDLVYANEQFITVCANSGSGERTLLLPGKHNVQDALTGEMLQRNCDRFTYYVQYKETRIFRLT